MKLTTFNCPVCARPLNVEAGNPRQGENAVTITLWLTTSAVEHLRTHTEEPSDA